MQPWACSSPLLPLLRPTLQDIKCVYDGRASPHSLRGSAFGGEDLGEGAFRSTRAIASLTASLLLLPLFSLPCPSLSHLLSPMAGTGLIAHASLPCSWTFGCNVWLDGTANTFRREVWHCCGLHTFAASQYRCTAACLGWQDSPGLSVPIAVCVKAHIWSCIIFCHYIHVSSHISPYKYCILLDFDWSLVTFCS